ncbi:MAG: hypothetical protein ABI901_07545 [Roseiflexaceae bacterium]
MTATSTTYSSTYGFLVEGLRHERLVAAALAQLGAGTFVATWAAGRAMWLKQAIADALGTWIL